jgi:4-hydroxy-4-methyl-2-oxoglutarate aldolase
MTTENTNSAAITNPDELVEKFRDPRMTTEHIYSGGGTCLSTKIRSMIPGLRFAGRALTVRTLPGFTRNPIKALAQLKKGDVLVIQAGGDAEISPWGGCVHWHANRKGAAGVVIDGMTRDLLEMKAEATPLPIFARGQAPALGGFGTPTSGAVGEPIVCGNVAIKTGDLVFGDDDGVVAVPWEKANEVLQGAYGSIQFDEKEIAWAASGREIYDLLTMLWDPDGTQYKHRKSKWAANPKLDAIE